VTLLGFLITAAHSGSCPLADFGGRLPLRRGLDENKAAMYLSLSPSFFRRSDGDNYDPAGTAN
jgi:hypothetical protein